MSMTTGWMDLYGSCWADDEVPLDPWGDGGSSLGTSVVGNVAAEGVGMATIPTLHSGQGPDAPAWALRLMYVNCTLNVR